MRIEQKCDEKYYNGFAKSVGRCCLQKKEYARFCWESHCRPTRQDRSSGTLLVVRRPPMILRIVLDELLGHRRMRKVVVVVLATDRR